MVQGFRNDEIIFLTNPLESSLWDYSDAYIFVTGNINITGGNSKTKVAFKNCAPFKECKTEINKNFVDKTEHINIAMPMYNLLNTAIIILIHLVVYGSLKEMSLMLMILIQL